MQPDPVLIANTSAWLRKAAQDLARAGHCLTEENPDAEDALFHCQQAAEKALYAWAFRYPTNIAEPAPGEAEAARALAQEIVRDIASRLPSSVREAAEPTASE